MRKSTHTSVNDRFKIWPLSRPLNARAYLAFQPKLDQVCLERGKISLMSGTTLKATEKQSHELRPTFHLVPKRKNCKQLLKFDK